MHDNNSTIIIIESWFIPFDIIMIISTIIAVIAAFIFLSTIILDKTCHTVPMMLVANSCLLEFVFESDMLTMALFTLQNDLKQIQYDDSLCIFRSYLGYVTIYLQNYSYFLQAILRYFIVVYPTRLFYQSARFQLFLICSTWIFSFLCPISYLLIGEIRYIVDNQICQMPLRFSVSAIHNVIFIYTISMSLIILIYFKLVRYVKEMSKRVITANMLYRAQRELKMVRGIVILEMGLVILGFLYTLFIFYRFSQVRRNMIFELHIYLLMDH
jgi:hypothetical protein